MGSSIPCSHPFSYPFNTWDKVRPKSEAELNMSNPIANVVLVKLADPNAHWNRFASASPPR